MIDIIGQGLLFIGGIVTQLVLPSITFIALYSPSVVVSVPAHAADGIVLLRVIGAGSIVVVMMGGVRAR
jgi:hypothetical protein